MMLQQLLSGIVEVPADVEIGDLTLDSREVKLGDLFLACRGHARGNGRHGIEFAAQRLGQFVLGGAGAEILEHRFN